MLEEKTIRVSARDVKIEKSRYGGLYVCGNRTQGLWYTVLSVEEDNQGRIFVCLDTEVRWGGWNEHKSSKFNRGNKRPTNNFINPRPVSPTSR